MSDYDQIEKIFNGSWKYDRDENLEAFMTAMGENFLSSVDNHILTLSVYTEFVFYESGVISFHLFFHGEMTRQIWAAAWQNQQIECALSGDSDQPGHPPSLIRVFAVRMKKAWVLSYPLSAQRRLIGGCPGWSESALGAQSDCWFWHVAAHILIIKLANLVVMVYFVIMQIIFLIYRHFGPTTTSSPSHFGP